MYCTECGSKLIEGAMFCMKCGTKVPVSETNEMQAASKEPEITPVEGDDSSEIQKIRDCMTENASKCPKIKKIVVTNPPNKYGINSDWLHIKITGGFLKYFYMWDSKTGETKTISCMWTGAALVMFLFAAMFDCLFLNFYFEQEYFLVLTLCTMVLSIIWFGCSIGAGKETKEIENYLEEMIDCKSKRSAIFTIIQYVLNIIEIGLCISALVMGFQDSKLMSEGVSDNGSLNMQENVSIGQVDENVDIGAELSLSQTYSDEDEGFSFMYPDGWTVDGEYPDTLVMISAPNESMFTGSAANIEVTKDYADDAYFAASVSDFEEVLPIWLGDGVEDICVLSLDDISLNGFPARKLVYTAAFDGVSVKQILYFYIVNYNIYMVGCTSLEDLWDTYGPVFDKIIDSFTITVPFDISSQDEESFISAATNRVEGAYYIGDTVSMSQTYDSGESGYYDITMIDWGTYIPQYSSQIYVYITFEVVNTGDKDIFISAGNFNAYVNNYNTDIMLYENSLSATLSPGRQTSGNVYIEMSPNDISNLELEFGDIIFRIQDNSDQNVTELSSFSYNSLYLYSGNYESSNGTSMSVSIYSSFDEGNIVGNVLLYDSLNHEIFAELRDDGEGEGIYTLCLDNSNIMYIKFYENNAGVYYADVQGLNTIYTNANQIESYIMTEQYMS